ncbi:MULTISPECIES: hypothetical protein [unclassified Frondihabitans]|uniref:hypothetical protein n=1 Tax=unclassified Frondihabitans TaxID=2626248 RepID=UPI000F4FC24C|nr:MULTISPECIES: hypothetical protein [unclassified Frondihabitans]RPE77390.1 hypothetical protein EDF37_0034 [Frondihabitans sp. PhB153]RPF07666.1 hypothetical protein EDF39_0034 [Frondihabitans sp. PhB161]
MNRRTSPPLPPPRAGSTRPRRILLALLALLATCLLFAPPPPASALQSTGHGRGFLWDGDGVSWLGTYRLADGRSAFCLEVGRSSPVGNDYDLSSSATGLGLTSTEVARLAYIARTWSGTTDPVTAAAAQLSVWSITGLDGHTLEYYAGRANEKRDAVLKKAATFSARAAAQATNGVTADVSLTLDGTGAGRVRADLSARLESGGGTTVAAGAFAGTITLRGGTFPDGSSTKALRNGRNQSFRATGTTPINHVSATASFSGLPYRAVITVGSSAAGSQRLLFDTAPTGTATTTETVEAVSPRPFQPRVTTSTSMTRAAAGAAITDELKLSVRPGAGLLSRWGVYRVSGTSHPVPVTIRSRLLGPFAKKPATSSAWPAKAPEVCRVATVVKTGPGTYRTKPCTLPSEGYFVWVETIDPKDTPVAQGRSRVKAWKSPFASATEVTFSPPKSPSPLPSIATSVEHDEVVPGECTPDRLVATGFPTDAGDVVVESVLLGPFADAPADGHDFGPDKTLDDLPVAGRVKTVVTSDGEYESPCVEARKPGHYIWVFLSEGSKPIGAAQAVAPFADLIAHASERFVVSKHDVPTPTPTPSVPPTTPPTPQRTTPPTPSASTPPTTTPVPPAPDEPRPPRLLAFTGSGPLRPIAIAAGSSLGLGLLAVLTGVVARRLRARREPASTPGSAAPPLDDTV